MGADSVYFYYGVKRTIAASDQDQIEQLENEAHPIFNLAFDHKLHVAWGVLTDGADYFMLVGQEIGRFGIEGILEKAFSESQLLQIAEVTKQRLKEAGFTDPPAFIVQLQAQY